MQTILMLGALLALLQPLVLLLGKLHHKELSRLCLKGLNMGGVGLANTSHFQHLC